MATGNSPLPRTVSFDGGPLHVLVVCTANICRSPMAEAMLRRELVRRDVSTVVRSAGFLADGEPAHPNTVAVMAERGFDVSGHRSRRLTDELVGAQDLILTMERRHVRDIASAWPDALDRTHTLAGVAGSSLPEVSLAVWMLRLAAARDVGSLLGHGADDVADPMGRARRDFERTAQQLGELCAAVAERIAVAVRNHDLVVQRALTSEFVFKPEPGFF